MNYIPVAKLRRLVFRVNPSKVAARLSLTKRRIQNVEAVQLEEDCVPQQQQIPRFPATPAGNVASTIEESNATVEVRSPPVQNRISSSESDSIEEILRPPGETRLSVKKYTGSQSNHAQQHQQQLPSQENVDEIISVPIQENGESGESSGFVLENLQQPKTVSDPPASVPKLPAAHVSIEIDYVGIEEQNPTYVETYLNFMFSWCFSPFLPEGGTGGFWSYCQQLCFLQVVIYWAVTISSLLESLSVAKYYSIQFVAVEGDLEDFTDMAFYIMNVFLKSYSAYLFTMQQRRFAKMLKSIGRLRAFAARYSNVPEEKYDTKKVIILAITSMTMSILSVVFATGLFDWTPEDGVLLYTNKMANAIYIWTPEGYKSNSTGVDALVQVYRHNWTTETALMGFLYGGMRLCNRCLASATGDLILTAAATLRKQMFRLAKDVGNPENDINPVTLENFEAEGGQWEHYQLLKEAVDATNDTFDCLIKYMHVDNVMLFVYIIMNAFDGYMSILAILYYMYNIVKTSATYSIASNAAEKNDVFRRWILRLIWKSKDPMFISKAYAILHQMDKEPLGLGKGQFLIDEGFLFRFLGSVGSVFVLQAQTRENSSARN